MSQLLHGGCKESLQREVFVLCLILFCVSGTCCVVLGVPLSSPPTLVHRNTYNTLAKPLYLPLPSATNDEISATLGPLGLYPAAVLESD